MKYTIQIAASIVSIVAASIAPAFAGGYDAGQYQQQAGQVMTQGSARFLQVMSVRTIQIEAAPRQNSQTNGYMAMGAGTAVGGLLGNSIGNGNGRQAATVIGGLLGAIAGNAIANPAPEMVNAIEITMIDPNTNQIIVIAQGGNEQFAEGEDVMLITMGNSNRVTRSPRRNQPQALSANAPAQYGR